jgi:TPR repeat protein
MTRFHMPAALVLLLLLAGCSSSVPQRAEEGDADAQNSLGLMYDNEDDDDGVSQDFAQAVAWFQKAADQGHADAQYRLGIMYVYGDGVPQDDPQALAWFRKAADQGHANAQHDLGAMCYRGEGRLRDKVEAYKWTTLAVSRASDRVRGRFAAERDEMALFMTPEQVAEAQQLAEAWLASFEAPPE